MPEEPSTDIEQRMSRHRLYNVNYGRRILPLVFMHKKFDLKI